MNCSESRRLIDAYLDGELDLVRSLELEDHRRQCASCAAACDRGKALAQALSAGNLRYSAPSALADRVRLAVRATVSQREPRAAPPGRWWLSLAALVLIAAGFAAGSFYDRFVHRTQQQLVSHVVAAHIRSLQANHLTDVASSDRHTVKPWFNGKLDFGVPTVDLGSDGFELIGGRLDVLDLQPSAALVYRRRQHLINVFLQPAAASAKTDTAALTQQGYQVLHWTGGGMDYWAISDLNARELQEFAAQFRARQSRDNTN